MYRINPLQRNVLITTDEVIFHASGKSAMDPQTIRNSIIIAEERLILPVLGYDFYYSLIDTKNREVTAANKADLQTKMVTGITLKEGDLVNASEFLPADDLKLWKQHLWKLTAECVMLLAMPEGFVQQAAEGTVHTNPMAGPMTSAGVTTPELRSVKWAMDKKMMDRIDPLREAMHVYICKNKAKYPLYDKTCDCDVNGVAYKRKSDFVLGIYYDEAKNCGCYD